MRRDTLESLIADLGKVPVELRRELRPALVRAATPILRDAKDRSSWSSRIPGAIKLRLSLSARNPGVRLVTDVAAAPHARPFEGQGDNRPTFRHPVFGRDVWVQQRKRPFFFPAARAGAEGVMRESSAAVVAAARSAGFR
jgi:hypothetical protein